MRSPCSVRSRRRRAPSRARSISRGARPKVVVTEAEFPTVGHVWLAQESRGARVEWVPVRDGMIDATEYDALVDDRTAIVSASHGYYLNGFKQDLPRRVTRGPRARRPALRRRLSDARHGAGRCEGARPRLSGRRESQVPHGDSWNRVPVRAAATSSARLEPTITGWFGRANPFAFDVKRLDWSPAASRFDTGTPPIVNAYVARAGMEISTTSASARSARGSRCSASG